MKGPGPCSATTLNELMRAVEELRALGCERLTACAVVNGRPMAFAVRVINQGENGELVLELERSSIGRWWR